MVYGNEDIVSPDFAALHPGYPEISVGM
jgi:hypothetical protein